MDLMDYKSAQYKRASCCNSGKTRTGFQISTEPETASLGENKSIFSILPLTRDEKTALKYVFHNIPTLLKSILLATNFQLMGLCGHVFLV